jgi:peptidoglycan/LPS O-acetylase OafA/YrhL
MPEPTGVRVVLALVADLAFVLLFATIGRLSHDEGLTVAGVVGVAWPFVVALLVGWVVARRRSGWPVRMPGSATVWLLTAVLGLVLRVATGGGFAWSFGAVTLVVLGLFLVGWRCAVEVLRFAGEGLGRWADRAASRR